MVERGARWFKMFGSWLPMLKELDVTDVGIALLAALERMETGKEPEGLSRAVKPIYLLFRSEVLESCDRYQAKVKHAQTIAKSRKKDKAVQHCTEVEEEVEVDEEEDAEADSSSSSTDEEEDVTGCPVGAGLEPAAVHPITLAEWRAISGTKQN